MATTDKPTSASADATSQAQSGSAEPDFKAKNKPEKHKDEIQFFETTITKLVKRENSDGDDEWVEVMSDNLYPGEKLKSADDEEKLAEKETAARAASLEAAEERKAAKNRK